LAAAPHPPIATRWAPPSPRERGEGFEHAPSPGEGLTIGRPLSPAGGAEIAGVDLSRPLGAETVAHFRAALLERQFLVFPRQVLSREQQYAFSAQFGEVERHGGHRGGREGKRQDVAHVTANLDADGKPSGRGASGANYRWHTDKPYYATPPALTTLYAVELPPSGGDTEFANTRCRMQ